MMEKAGIFLFSKQELLTSSEKLALQKRNLFLVMIMSLPFTIVFSSLSFTLFCLVTLLDISKEKIRSLPRQFWVFQLIYIPTLISSVYSYYKGNASALIERQLSIALLPLFIPLAFNVTTDMVKLVLRVLCITLTFTVAFLFAHVLHEVIFNLKLPVTAIFSGVFFNHGFSRPIGIHAGYLSLFVALSILYAADQIRKNSSSTSRALHILSALILTAGLVFLASRNTIVSLALILIVVLPAVKGGKFWRQLLVTVLILAGLLVAISKVEYLRQRFSVGVLSEFTEVRNLSSIYFVEPRLERWKCAVDVIADSPVIGHGTGDENAMLRYEYLKRGLYISYLENFNAHNEYLSYTIKHGLLGLLIFIGAFVYYFVLAIRSRHFIYISFLIILLLGFYTENILDTNKGILFFSIFNTLFGYECLNLKKQKSSTQP